jgi:hypothetical protein
VTGRRNILSWLLILAGVALAALVPAASVAGTAHSAAAAPRMIIGMSNGAADYGNHIGARLDQLQTTLGAKWLRDNFYWSIIEPTPGHYDFSYYDTYMLQLAQRGMHELPLIVGAPRWAAPTVTSLSSNATAFGKVVAAIVNRYGPNGSFWNVYPNLKGSAIHAYELWNEPYFSSGNGGRWDPGRYTRMVRAAWIYGHRADPKATFLLEAEMAAHPNPKIYAWWIDALYTAMPDLNKYFNGVAIHDFGRNLKDLPVIQSPYQGFGHVRRVENIHAQLAAHGAGHKPFWITEAGWATCTAHVVDCFTPAQQLANYKTFFRYTRTLWRGWIKAVFVYRFQDGGEPVASLAGYGLVDLKGNPKPALAFVRQMMLQSL